MMISRTEIESVLAAFRAARMRETPYAPSLSYDTEPVSGGETSTAAAAYAKLAAIVTAEPLYREERVTDLQQLIADGSYHVPGEQIVDKLLGRLVTDALPA
jgi:Anti-sigma-28 factor, FlgM